MSESEVKAPSGGPESRSDRMAEEARRLGHDLNNMIGVISGRAELIQMHLDRGNVENVRKGVDVILGQIPKIKTLSDELRALRDIP